MNNSSFKIHHDTYIGHVHLRVSDIKRALKFYVDLLGFKLTYEKSGTLFLSAKGKEPYLVALSKSEKKGTGMERQAGLYHFAILLPSRRYLAILLRHLLKHRDIIYFEGAADHLVSEAIYIRDPDLIGIEIYRDRDRSQWRRAGVQVQMATEPLDIDSLLEEAEGVNWDGMPDGTIIGHVHLHVSDLVKARKFYSEMLGFNQTYTYPSAYFYAADEYHHHIATNTWLGQDIPAASQERPGLDHYAIKLPSREAFQQVLEQLSKHGLAIQDCREPGLSDSICIEDPDKIKIQLYRE